VATANLVHGLFVELVGERQHEDLLQRGHALVDGLDLHVKHALDDVGLVAREALLLA
jgi:hypothetical protein